jgi:hypothetical protein
MQIEQILVIVTSDHPEIFQNIQKNAAYINHLMTKQTNAKFFMEVIDQGLLYIYDDWETFELLNQPFNSRDVARFTKRAAAMEDFRHIFPLYLTEDTFPPEGIEVFFHTESPRKAEIVEIGKRQFASLLGEFCEISIRKSGDLALHFTTFMGFSLYLALMASLMQGIFRKIDRHKKAPENPQQSLKPLI